MWVLSAFLVCRVSPRKDQKVIYKSALWWTVKPEANPASPPLSLMWWHLDAARLSSAFIPLSVQLTSVRVCVNQRSPVCMKSPWRRALGTPATWLNADGRVLQIRQHTLWQVSSQGWLRSVSKAFFSLLISRILISCLLLFPLIGYCS